MISLLAKNLKNLMQKLSISESALSRQTSISQPVINRIIKGLTTNPNVETLRPLAKFFKVSVGQLIGDEPLFSINEENNYGSTAFHAEWIDVPIMNWEVVAQSLVTIRNRKIEKNKFIRLHDKLSDSIYALVIEDITMEPTFLKDTIIVVDPKLEPVDQDYVVLLIKGQKKAIFRQILFSGDKIFFKAINTGFDDIRSTKSFKILGTVIQTHFSFKRKSSDKF